MTKQGWKIGMPFQIANVTKLLGSVRAILDAGKDVVFEKGNIHIMDKSGEGENANRKEEWGIRV